MRRLDEIKARDYAADFADLDLELLRRSSADVPALVAAVEAVLALHYLDIDEEHCADCSYNWPCPTVTAIRDALGEDA